MTPRQKLKVDRLASIVGYLKFTGTRMTAVEIHAELSALNVGMYAMQKYLRELVKAQQIHFLVEPRIGSNGAPKQLYAYGPNPDSSQSISKPRFKEISAQCTQVDKQEWPRGQHGRDPMVAAFFGGAHV